MDEFDVVHGENPYGSTAVEDAVRRELNGIDVADAVLEHVAIELARQIDQGRAVAAASRELRLVMGALRGGVGVVDGRADELDELQARREARRQANG